MDQSIIGTLEQQRRDALVAWYLGQLVPQAEEPRRVLTENDLYEYLLIDNQVTAQVDTSRVAQGIASVQQHIHAIYNGMEPGYSGASQEALALWRDGMSQYSLWAGYQMLEDYPENYLDPALRLDKSEMFKTFESQLSQARLTQDTVQTALGNYLQAFETIANLQITGCYVDSPNFVDADYFFIGRQSIEPFAFHWRKAHLYAGESPDSAQIAGWTEWKPVDAVTGEHIKHCRPVVMDGRLYVVWAESGREVLGEDGKKTGRFVYTLKLAYRRLDDSWSVPILLHTGEAPDELSANEQDDEGSVTRGYRLAASTDHGNNGKSRLLISFRSVGFGTEDIGHLGVRDDLLNALSLDATDTQNVERALAYMFGLDSRRVQFNCDELDGDADYQWKVTSVVWDRNVPPTTMGAPELATNDELELDARWQGGRLALQGFCRKVINVRNDTEFRYHTSGYLSPTQQFEVAVFTENGIVHFRVKKISTTMDYYPGSVSLRHNGEELCVVNSADFGWLFIGYNWTSVIARKDLTIDPNSFDDAGVAGGFEVGFEARVPIALSSTDNYYRTRYVPAVMSSGIAHYTHQWLLQSHPVSLNGAARTPLIYDEWSAGDPDVRTYQWGDSLLPAAEFGLNGFTVTREPVGASAPIVATLGSGSQYLDLRPIDAGFRTIRLNTLFAKELTRKASLSLESALSWETQHTEEPVLPGQTAPVYLEFSGANGLYFWELFFHAPHLIATRLQQEFDYPGAQRWLEYLFNPQMRVAPLYPPPSETEWLPYWSCRPLGLADNPALELEGVINPDAIARGAPSHYRKAIFTLYLNNLIAWGDMLYRQVTRDTLNEAKLLYVRALSLLGPLSKGRSISRWAPMTLADAIEPAADSFATLEASMAASVSTLLPVTGDESPWLRLLDLPAFRLPVNTQLLDLWDQLDLRLHNLRHNLTLDGKPMHLALYEAPANPLDLLRAQLNGSSLSQRRLGSLSIVPAYRFRAMLPRAQGAVETLVRFAQQVLSHMELRDRAQQDELQQGHVLDDLAAFAERLQEDAIEETSKGIEVLQANRQVAAARKAYYEGLLSKDVSEFERTAQTERFVALGSTVAAHTATAGGHLASLIANLYGGATGGMNWGGPGFAVSEILEAGAAVTSELAQQQLTSDMQTRRRDEWQHQAKQAELELDVLDRQIDAQRVVLQSAQTSLAQATRSREQAQALYAYIKGRPTNAGLYQWLLSQMSTLYFQAYDAVLSMCLSAEACWHYEMGDRDSRFISATAWVDNRFGLTAGESLKLGLLQMESAFLSRHERRLELTKTLSLKDLLSGYASEDVTAAGTADTGWAAVLDTLRANGEIDFQLKSSTFDKDYPGHYLRQLVRVSVSLPVVLKPYQDIRATLSQQASSYLLKPQIGNVKYLYQQANELPEGNDDDIRQDQIVFNPRANQQIGLSSGVDDHGMFMVDFGDERYFPFEGTGAISHWTLSFPNHESEDQQAMLDSLTDIILHVRYMAVDGGRAFAAEVEELVAAVEEGERSGQPTSLT